MNKILLAILLFSTCMRPAARVKLEYNHAQYMIYFREMERLQALCDEAYKAGNKAQYDAVQLMIDVCVSNNLIARGLK